MANGLFGGGDGTINNPFLVEDAEDLNAVRNKPGDDYFLQTQDIDLSNYPNWQPIANYDGYFTGIYKGNNKKIIGFKHVGNEVYFALFGYLGGSLENITLEDIDLECTTAGNTGFDDNWAGLTLGQGGFVFANSRIINCHVTGKIKVNRKKSVGGIAAILRNINIEKCSFEGQLLATSPINSIGGIVGTISGKITIKNCYSISNGKSLNLAGYVELNNLKTIDKCYVVNGRIIGSKDSDVAAINLSVVDSYYDNTMESNGYGTPKSLAEMQQRATFTNWIFDNKNKRFWLIKEGVDYPRFSRIINIELLYRNSIGGIVDRWFWDHNIFANGINLYSCDYQEVTSLGKIIIYLPCETTCEINTRISGKLGFEKVDKTETVNSDVQIIISAQLYDFANQQTYYLYTPQDFISMKDEFGKYIVMNDIDFEGFEYKIPFDVPFLGDFDGNNNTLKNLTIKATEEYRGEGYGLLGNTVNAIVKNIVIENSTITDEAGELYNPSGFIVGKMEQRILDKYQPEKNRLMRLHNCVVKDSTLAFANRIDQLGTFIGSVITQSDAFNSLDITDYTAIESLKSHNIEFDLNDGILIGGVAGLIRIEDDKLLSIATDVEVYSIFDFNNTGGDLIGGLFGQANFRNAILQKVGANTILKNATPINFGFGGLFGQVDYQEVARLENWYADTVVENSVVNSGFGGITAIWMQENAIEMTISKGYIATNTELTADEGRAIGVFWGYNSMSVSPSMTDIFIDGDINSLVQGQSEAPPEMLKTTAQMKNKSTFTNFDFENVWVLDPDSYPKFKSLAERAIKLCKRMPLFNFRRK